MSTDDKNEQSVMLSLDDLLAQDPSLGSINQHGHHSNAPDVNQKALDQIGLNQNAHRPVAPVTNAAIPMRHGDVQTKGSASKILGILGAICAVVALVGAGVFIGQMNTPASTMVAPQALAPVPAPVVNTPAPQPSPSSVMPAAVQTEASETKAEAQPTAPKVKVKPKTKPKPRVRSRSAKQASKPEPKPEPQAVPDPKPESKPKPRVQQSEASALLSKLKGGKTAQDHDPLADEPSTKQSNLPSRLGRTEILSTTRKNRNSIRRCSNHVKERTTIKMRMVIAGSGKVTQAALSEPAELKGTAVDQCMSERVKLYKFPQFSSPSMKVRLSFIL